MRNECENLIENLMEENGENRKIACLSEMCSNSPCELGALTSESFFKWIASAANVHVDAHHARLDHDDIDNMVVLRMNKSFMERSRRKKAFTSIVFHCVLSDEDSSMNEDWKYQTLICYNFHHVALNYSRWFFVLVNVILIYSF